MKKAKDSASLAHQDGREAEDYFKRFSRGAAMFNWMWALAFRRWGFAFLLLVLAVVGTFLWVTIAADLFVRKRPVNLPMIGVAVLVLLVDRIIVLVLGYRANRMAWESGRFGTLAELKATQRVWDRWAWIVVIIALGMLLLAFVYVLEDPFLFSLGVLPKIVIIGVALGIIVIVPIISLRKPGEKK